MLNFRPIDFPSDRPGNDLERLIAFFFDTESERIDLSCLKI